MCTQFSGPSPSLTRSRYGSLAKRGAGAANDASTALGRGIYATASPRGRGLGCVCRQPHNGGILARRQRQLEQRSGSQDFKTGSDLGCFAQHDTGRAIFLVAKLNRTRHSSFWQALTLQREMHMDFGKYLGIGLSTL